MLKSSLKVQGCDLAIHLFPSSQDSELRLLKVQGLREDQSKSVAPEMRQPADLLQLLYLATQVVHQYAHLLQTRSIPPCPSKRSQTLPTALVLHSCVLPQELGLGQSL